MDKVKKTPKPKITEAEEIQAKADAEAAKELLEDDRFKFFRDYLVKEKEDVINNAVNNKLKKIILKKDTHDVVYEKWEQEAEDAGKFKFIFALIDRITWILNYPKEIEKAKEKGQLEVER